MSQRPDNLFYFIGNFEDFTLQTASVKGLMIVNFYASWCPSCSKLDQIINDLANENPNIVFYKVDIDQSAEFSHYFCINNVPIVKFLNRTQKDIEEVGSIVGIDGQLIRDKINQLVL